MISRLLLSAALILAAVPAAAKIVPHPEAEAQALDLAKQAISIRSVMGEGNKTGDVATLFRDALVKGGFDGREVAITPMRDTAYLIATWRGSDPALKPLVLSGHMDVVEAKRADWQRDPFVPVVENGYLFGRGATDMKFDGALAIAALIELKREGYKPRRSIVIDRSGSANLNTAESGKAAPMGEDRARHLRSRDHEQETPSQPLGDVQGQGGVGSGSR